MNALALPVLTNPPQLKPGEVLIWADLTGAVWAQLSPNAAVQINAGGDGTGDVTGPASSTDGVMALFDGVTGKLLKAGVAPGTQLTPDTDWIAPAGTGSKASLSNYTPSDFIGSDTVAIAQVQALSVIVQALNAWAQALETALASGKLPNA